MSGKTNADPKVVEYFQHVALGLIIALVVFAMLSPTVMVFVSGQAIGKINYFIFAFWPPNILLIESINSGNFSDTQVFVFFYLNSLLSFTLLLWLIWSLPASMRLTQLNISGKALFILGVAMASGLTVYVVGFRANGGLYGFGLKQPIALNIAKSIILISMFYICFQFFAASAIAIAIARLTKGRRGDSND